MAERLSEAIRKSFRRRSAEHVERSNAHPEKPQGAKEGRGSIGCKDRPEKGELPVRHNTLSRGIGRPHIRESPPLVPRQVKILPSDGSFPDDANRHACGQARSASRDAHGRRAHGGCAHGRRAHGGCARDRRARDRELEPSEHDAETAFVRMLGGHSLSMCGYRAPRVPR